MKLKGSIATAYIVMALIAHLLTIAFASLAIGHAYGEATGWAAAAVLMVLEQLLWKHFIDKAEQRTEVGDE